MDYFKNILKDMRIFSLLMILASITSFGFIEIFKALYGVNFSVSIFIASYSLSVVIVFGTSFIWAIRREYKLENGLE